MKQLPKSKTATFIKANYQDWYSFLRADGHMMRPLSLVGNCAAKQAHESYKNRYLVDYYAVDIIARYSDNRWIKPERTIGKRVIWKRTKLGSTLVGTLKAIKVGGLRFKFNRSLRRWEVEQ